jgi:FKBP-type peptidyl-prolyl cis-trans isomerase (trigger factor)
LNKIADTEKIEADKEAVDAEIKHALEHFPDANPELVRIHIETVLKNEKVLRMLEGDATPVTAAPHDHSHE